MPKKSGGLFTLLSGVAMGAAAVFLSKKENRDKASKALHQAGEEIEQAVNDYKKDPEAFKKRVVKKGKAVARKATTTAKKSVKKTTKKKTTAKKKTASKKKS